jgi:hypothetical protein
MSRPNGPKRRPRTSGSVRGRVRAVAEYVDGATVKFTLPCGHYRTEELTERKPGGGRKPMNVSMVKFLAKYWGPGQGVNVKPCKTCQRKQPPA